MTDLTIKEQLIAFDLESIQSLHRNTFTVDNVNNIISIADIMTTAIRHGNKILACGNGGSFSDAQHFASELVGKYRGVRPALPAIALSDGGAMSCIANDFGYTYVFKRQVEALGKPGDVLLCLSTSGNSKNVLTAAEHAKRTGLKVVAISGQSGGQLKEWCDVMVNIPHVESADRIQEVGLFIIHVLVNLIEKSL